MTSRNRAIPNTPNLTLALTFLLSREALPIPSVIRNEVKYPLCARHGVNETQWWHSPTAVQRWCCDGTALEPGSRGRETSWEMEQVQGLCSCWMPAHLMRTWSLCPWPLTHITGSRVILGFYLLSHHQDTFFFGDIKRSTSRGRDSLLSLQHKLNKSPGCFTAENQSWKRSWCPWTPAKLQTEEVKPGSSGLPVQNGVPTLSRSLWSLCNVILKLFEVGNQNTVFVSLCSSVQNRWRKGSTSRALLQGILHGKF